MNKNKPIYVIFDGDSINLKSIQRLTNMQNIFLIVVTNGLNLDNNDKQKYNNVRYSVTKKLLSNSADIRMILEINDIIYKIMPHEKLIPFISSNEKNGINLSSYAKIIVYSKDSKIYLAYEIIREKYQLDIEFCTKLDEILPEKSNNGNKFVNNIIPVNNNNINNMKENILKIDNSVDTASDILIYEDDKLNSNTMKILDIITKNKKNFPKFSGNTVEKRNHRLANFIWNSLNGREIATLEEIEKITIHYYNELFP